MKKLNALLFFILSFNFVFGQENSYKLHQQNVKYLYPKDIYSSIPVLYKNKAFNGYVFFLKGSINYKENLLFDSIALSALDFNSKVLSELYIMNENKIDTANIEAVTYYKNGLVESQRYYDKGFLVTEKLVVNRLNREYRKIDYYKNGELKYDGVGHNKIYLSTSYDIEDAPFVEFFINGKIKKKGYFGDKSLKEDYFITKEYNNEGGLIEMYKYNGIKRPGSLNFRNDDYVIETYKNNTLYRSKIVVNQNPSSSFDFFENGSIKKEYYPGGDLKKEYNENGDVISELNYKDANKPQIVGNSQTKQKEANTQNTSIRIPKGFQPVSIDVLILQLKKCTTYDCIDKWINKWELSYTLLLKNAGELKNRGNRGARIVNINESYMLPSIGYRSGPIRAWVSEILTSKDVSESEIERYLKKLDAAIDRTQKASASALRGED